MSYCRVFPRRELIRTNSMKTILLSVTALLMSGSLLIGAPKKDIVDTAVEAGSFKTLISAVKTAALVDTLKG